MHDRYFEFNDYFITKTTRNEKYLYLLVFTWFYVRTPCFLLIINIIKHILDNRLFYWG